MDNSLFSPIDIPINTIATSGPNVKEFLCIIEGWKTKIKNLHWAAPRMNTHKLLDEIADFVSDYQDSLAEDYMGIEGKFDSSFLHGIPESSNDVRSLLKVMIAKTKIFYTSLPEKSVYAGIKSEAETFIHNLNKYTYLATLVD